MIKRFFASILRLGMIIALLTGTFVETAPAIAAPVAAPKQEVTITPLLAPVASVGLSVPANVMVGENFTFTASFSNTSGTATDVGYGPFIDIVLPTNGADGNGNQNPPLDGVSFISASYLGNAVTATVLTFPGSGAVNTCVNHPYAVAPSTGAALQVCGVSGNTLVVLQLPFGSFVPGQPTVDVTITASLSNLADVNTALNIRARGGYQYGATPLSDWCCSPFDATILSNPSTNSTTWSPSPVTPRLFTVTKTYNGPEDETATGPNFSREYTVTVDIANGQTLTNLDVTDTLPNNMQFIAFVGSTPASSAISTPSTATSGGALTRRFASVTGTTSAADVTMTFSFYIPRLNAGATAVIDATTGAPATSVNEAQAAANWTPVDTRDSATPVVGVCTSPCHTLTDRSIATQKSVATITDTSPTGTSPGDTLEYTLDFQISDFFAFDNVVLTDVLSDGQRLDLSFTPTLQFTGNGYALATAVFAPANYTVDNSQIGNTGPNPPADGTDGTQTLIFRVSNEVVTRGQPNGRLIGGCINPVSGSNPPDCSTFNDGATNGTIIFRAIIQQNFTDTYPSGDASVDHGDVLNNDVTIIGDVLNPTTSAFTATGSVATDDSAVGLVVGFGGLTKSVYAINGSVCDPCTTEITTTGIKPDDTVTYRLTYTMPASDFEPTVITDYLPLPVFFATEVTIFSNAICGVPAAGNACLGSNDTFHTLTTPVPSAPTLSTDGTANTVKFSYAAYDNTSDITSTVDLLLTVTVTGEPFADGLFLTNQANVTEGTTNATPTAQNAIVLIKLNEPALYTTKAAVSTDNPNGVFLPTVAAPIAFNAPGTGGLSWSGGTISSTYLGTNSIDSNLSKVDAGDLVRFAIVIHNEGHSQKGAFDISIRDTFQPGYVIPGGLGLNLQIYRGDGLALTYTDLGGGIFGTGIKIDDPGAPGVGACQAHDATNGQNVIVITYDLQLDTAITLNQGIINTAALFNYGSVSGGPDFTNPNDLIDTATVQPVTAPTKSIVTTSETFTSEAGVGTNGNPRLAAVGEIVRFRIEQGLPEGTVTNFRLHDVLPTGLIFLNDNTSRVVFISDGGGGVTSDTMSGAGLNVTGNETTVGAITPTFVLPDTAVSGTDSTSTANYATDNLDTYASGDDIYFKLGTVDNTDRDNNSEFVVVEFNVIVANIAANTTGINRNNTATARYGTSTTDSASSNSMRVRVVEPSITFGKTIVSLPSPLDAGGVVQYQLSFANGTGANVSTAFDVNLTDPLPAQLSLNLASVNITLAGGASGATNTSALNNVNVTIASVPAGGSVIIDYTATIQDTVTEAEVITNTSVSTWTSLPGTGTSPNGTGSVTGVAGGTTGERTGTGISPNTYTSTGSQNFTITSPTTITKQLTTTSASHTVGSSVAIGEEITYDILLTFPEGTTQTDTVVDDLPTGLQMVSGTPQIITTAAASGGLLTADFNGTIGAQNITVVTGDAGSVQFDYTNVVVTGDNNTTNNTLLMRFRAQVTNIAANISGTTISNAATNQVGANAPITTTPVTATVVEPSITFGKTIVSLPTPLDAGGVVHYQITYANGIGVNVSTAMDVNITDALAAELLLPSTSSPDIVITSTAGVGAVTNNSTTSNIDIVIASIPSGESVTVDFYPVIQNTITSGQIIDNIGNSTWTSLSGTVTGERTGADGPTGSPDNYSATDNKTFTSDTLGPVKSIVSTSEAHTSDAGDGSAGNPRDLAIGEIIRYRLAVQLTEGTTSNLQLVDTLPAGFTYLNDGTTSISFLANTDVTEEVDLAGADNDALPPSFTLPAGRIGVLGQDVTFTVGDLVNNDSDGDQEFVIIDFNVIVNNDANSNNTDLDNNDFDLIVDGSNIATSNTVGTRIVEPFVAITKSVSDEHPAPGQTVTFTLVVTNTGDATAFEVDITDGMPNELSLDLSSITITPTGTVSGVSNTSTAAQVHVTVVSIDVGGGLIITYDAAVNATLNDVFVNDAEISWTSLPGPNGTLVNPTGSSTPGTPGSDTGERDGSESPALNDYKDIDQVQLIADRNLVKNLVVSNLPSTGFNAPYEEVGIGEILTYQVVLTIPENSTDIAIITDTLGNGLAFVDCSQMVTSDVINVTSSTVDFTDSANCNHGITIAVNNPVISNSGGATTAGDIITFDLGDIVNNAGSPETITLTYRVIVLDIASNVQSVTLDNDVEWTWGTGNLSTKASPSLSIVEPDMQIEKTVDPTIASLGSIITYTIEISHTNDSLTTAYDVRVTDNIPTGLALVPGSVSVTDTGGPVGETIVESPTQIMVWWSEFPLLATATITFDAEFIGPSPVFNSANVEWKSLQIDPAPPPLQSAPSVAQSIYNNFSTERRYDPGDLTGVNSYVASSTAVLAVPPRLPKTGFAPNVVTALPEQPSGFAYTALADLWIEIPRLGIKTDIVGIPFDQEDWNLTWLGRQTGYLAGTAFPSHKGNTGLTAHAYLADGTPGPFVNLDKLQYGDQIIIHLSGQKYTYEVREESLVHPDAVASVLKHEEYAWLTLITCKSYNEQTGDYTYRSVVRAVLVNVIDE